MQLLNEKKKVERDPFRGGFQSIELTHSSTQCIPTNAD